MTAVCPSLLLSRSLAPTRPTITLGKAATVVTLREPSVTTTIACTAVVWNCRADPPGLLVLLTLSLGAPPSPVVMKRGRREAVLMRLRWAVVEVEVR